MSDHHPIKAGLDIASVVALIGWASSVLPAIATLLTVVWSVLRIYEAILVIRLKKSELSRFEQGLPPPT